MRWVPRPWLVMLLIAPIHTTRAGVTNCQCRRSASFWLGRRGVARPARDGTSNRHVFEVTTEVCKQSISGLLARRGVGWRDRQGFHAFKASLSRIFGLYTTQNAISRYLASDSKSVSSPSSPVHLQSTMLCVLATIKPRSNPEV